MLAKCTSLSSSLQIFTMPVTPLTTKEEFDAAIADSKLVVVDFYADWCGPCKIIGPKLEAMSEKYKDEVAFFKVNVDELEEVAEECKISSMPTFLFYQNNGKVGEVIGASEDKIVAEIEKYTF